MELKRDLGLGAAISIVIGTVIGSGIFLGASRYDRARPHAGNGVLHFRFRRTAFAGGRAQLCRTRGNAARGRRRIRLSARSLRTVLGIPLQLDSNVGCKERFHRDARNWFFPLLSELFSLFGKNILAKYRFRWDPPEHRWN